MKISKWDVLMVNFNPTRGAEINKVRPCVVVSPQLVNDRSKTITVIPLTTKLKNYPYRQETFFNGEEGQACMDHIRSIDKSRIAKKMGVLDKRDQLDVQYLIETYFSE